MELCIVSFTENGKRLSESIARKSDEFKLFTKYKGFAVGKQDQEQPVVFVETSIGEWAKEQMQEKNAMLFIGACGIAVRAIAPHLTDKLNDVPVLVMDEKGRYVIPILSGHMGGANELAAYLAEKTGAKPVITTATDINGKFAVDLFAKENGLFIVNKDGIAKVSSKVLDGKEITLSVTPELRGNLSKGKDWPWGSRDLPSESAAWQELHLPTGVRITPYSPEHPVDVLITSKEGAFHASLILRPKEYVIGMGCKKGKSAHEIEEFISKTLNELGISRMQIIALSSISQKKDEPGLIAWSRKESIPFLTYTAQDLQEVEGDFKKSSFVEVQVGVDNVCERAAIKACGPGGKLIYEKCAKNGMTIAIAKREWKVKIYES